MTRRVPARRRCSQASRSSRRPQGFDRSAVRPSTPCRRPLVRDQDVRSAGVRADRVDRGPRCTTRSTFRGSDVSKPVLMAARATRPRATRRRTFDLRRDIRFADGTPRPRRTSSSRSAADQPQGQPGLPARRRDRLRAWRHPHGRAPLGDAEHGDPAIVANTSLGIVNSKLARRTARPTGRAPTRPTRRRSGSTRRVEGRRQRPVRAHQYSTTSRIVLDQNPSYWGRKPAFERVVVRNMVAATQFINIQRGQHEVAIDLSAQQPTR